MAVVRSGTDSCALWLRLVVALVCAAFLEAPAAAKSFAEHFNRAVEFRLDGQSDAAITELRRALELNPRSVDAHIQLGLILIEEKGDVDGAISEYVGALSIDPACVFCQMRLNEAVDLKNSKAKDLVARGNQLYVAGQLHRAVAAYRIAIDVDAQDATAHNSLAWTLYRLGQLEEGMREVKEALRLKPDDPEFVNTEACLLFDRGQVDEAIGQWKRAIALSKSPNPADLYGLAIGSLEKGDRASAARYFQEAVKIDPNYKELKYVRDRIGMSVRAVAAHDQLLALTQKGGS